MSISSSSDSSSSSYNDDEDDDFEMVLATFIWYDFRQYFILNQLNDTKSMWEQESQNCFHPATDATPTLTQRWKYPTDGDTEGRYVQNQTMIIKRVERIKLKNAHNNSNGNDTTTTQMEDKDGHYKLDMDDDDGINRNMMIHK